MKITKRFRVRVPARAHFIWLSLLGSSVLFSNLCRYPVVPSYRRRHDTQHNDTKHNYIQHNLLIATLSITTLSIMSLCWLPHSYFVMLNVVFLFRFVEYILISLCYAGCHYAECLGVSAESAKDQLMFLCNQYFLTE